MIGLFKLIEKNQFVIISAIVLFCLLNCFLFFILLKILFYRNKQFYSSILYRYTYISINFVLFYFIFIEKIIINLPFFILFSENNKKASISLMEYCGQDPNLINCFYYSGMFLDYDMLLLLTPNCFILTIAQGGYYYNRII
uniref:Uncharacterized protein n=1 Tax=Cyanophora sudae TaxID=1522369 RepID=A0A873WRW0_9EUKA|nr:hypothetical protein DXZ12_mgp34 [Cyanophora sudae]QPB15066.1 hypothetical protein [Cyanophora sudae]